MDGEQATDQGTEQPMAEIGSRHPRGFGRPWKERYVKPVKYRQSTIRHHERDKTVILLSFCLPPGQDRIDDAVFDILCHHKMTKEGRFPTNLHYGGVRRSDDGQTWVQWTLPDNSLGRVTAHQITTALDDLASKLQHGNHR